MKPYSPLLKPFSSYTMDECILFLTNNYGFKGINRTGLTYYFEDRNIDSMRKECKIQHDYNLRNGIND